MKKKLAFLVIVLVVVAGILASRQYAKSPYGLYASSPDDPETAVDLDQQWEEDARAYWYGASQGSRLIPLDWLEALEQSGSTDLFMTPENIRKFNFIPRKVEVPNRDDYAQLALGVVIDNSSDENLERTKLRWKANQSNQENWVGLTCAACHTGEIKYKGKEMRIDGGGALIDFQSFIHSLNETLKDTFNNSAKWARFEEKVLTQTNSPPEYAAKLRAEYEKLLNWQILEERSNISDVEYGYGRIDAFGHIYNKVALLVDDENQKFNPPDAPVSIPAVWSSSQFNKVQYTGAASRVFYWGVDVGALARNMGEFVGVFGDVVVDEKLGKEGFYSSVDMDNLYYLEKSLTDLRAPKWPQEIFGPFSDEAKQREAELAVIGSELYQQNCVLCHDVVDRTDTDSDITVQENYLSHRAPLAEGRARNLPEALSSKTIPPVSTDPWMACNAYSSLLNPGLWSSTDSDAMEVNFQSIQRGDSIVLGEKIEASKLLTVTVAGVIAANKNNLTELIGKSFLNTPRVVRGIKGIDTEKPVINLGGLWKNFERIDSKTRRLEECLHACYVFSQTRPKNNALGYTSRPLTGIWATAPYLHNGSIPTLYDLLSPVKERPITFWTGSNEFDPVKVGFITQKTDENRFEFKSRKHNGDSLDHIDGNSNAGHNYNKKAFTHEERMALIAYLKTL